MSKSRKKLLDGDSGVAEDAAKGAEGNLGMKGNGDREASRVGWVAEPHMAALLAHGDILEHFESP